MRPQRFFVALSTALPPLFAAGQNLIFNPGFETYTALPTISAQPCNAAGWATPAGTCIPSVPPGCGSPDYYHMLSPSATISPAVLQWGTCTPHSGQGMMGVGPFQLLNTGYREYVSTVLTTPLIVGAQYEVGTWISNGTASAYNGGTNHNGFVFSTSPIAQSCGLPIITSPTVEIPVVLHSTNWQFVSVTFTATQAFTHMCFGNFVAHAATTYQSFGSGPALPYYYIDDMSLTLVTSLPIELIGFTATSPDGRTALLQWTTASETDNARFVVERSRDMAQWSVVGEVPGALNSSSEQHYATADPAPPPGINYYRLRQVDTDGNSSLSNAVPLTIAHWSAGALTCVPQPANGLVTVHPDTDLGIGNAILEVCNVAGAIVMQYALATDRSGPIRLDIGHLVPGLYTMNIRRDEHIVAHGLLMCE